MTSERVFILATVRKPELLPAALLVFKTLRLGFPEALVSVTGNQLSRPAEAAVCAAAAERVCGFHNSAQPMVHDRWIEALVLGQTEPFWVCDTDVVFNARMEGLMPWHPEDALAGRLEPGFEEEFTGTYHVGRLHTAVMWINPLRLREQMMAWMCRLPEPWRASAEYPFVRQHFVPRLGGRPLFYDTMAGCWQAGMGRPFNEGTDASFDHLHCATYADLVDAPSLSGLREMHAAIYADPARAVELRPMQQRYYESRGKDTSCQVTHNHL